MRDEDWILYALELAKRAAQKGEIPVGAVIVYQGEVLGEGWNQPIASHDPTAHAEIQAIREAANRIGNYRLLNTILYATLEPCAMCAGAMVHARINRLVYGAHDPKAGAVKTRASLLDSVHLNHKVSWEGGILADSCGQVLTQFFKKKREKQ